MSYTVIARTWRPRRFEDVVGQPHITTTLKNSIQSGRISHAYLFTGPRGVGKTSMARILAKAVNCQNAPSAEPCDQCENCKGINSGNFVDVIEIDAASKTGVDEMRELSESVHYMPMRGIYKVYILDESHMLSKSAVSALLKTLEEQPGHNIFILATTEVQKIKKEVEKSVNDAFNTAMQNLWERLRDVVARMVDKLSDKDAVFRDSLVENIVELVNILPKLNVTGDPKLTKITKEIEGSLCNVSPKELRDNEVVREKVATKAKSILDAMEGYMGGK